MDQFQRVQTLDNVVFGYPLAGLGARFLATLVDYIIIAAFSVAGWYVISTLLSARGSAGNWLTALVGLLLFALQWGYYVLFEVWWSGQSPGKRLLRLRVVRSDGSPIHLEDSVVRNLIRIIDYLPFNYFVGFVAICTTSRMQRLGDLAAGTIVVRERQVVTLDDLE